MGREARRKEEEEDGEGGEVETKKGGEAEKLGLFYAF